MSAPGGTSARPNEWPFFVAFRSVDVSARRMHYFCGGALVDRQWVLTAAHCIEGLVSENGEFRDGSGAQVEAVVGATDVSTVRRRQIFQISDTYVHPDYTGGNEPAHDVALVRLNREQPKGIILLFREPYAPHSIQAAGFGLLSEGGPLAEKQLSSQFVVSSGNSRLMSVVLQEMRQCSEIFEIFDPDTQLCVGDPDGRQDTCQGDSGGPLVRRSWTGDAMLIGIVSFGRGCARSNSPGVYSSAAAYKSWVFETIKQREGRQINASMARDSYLRAGDLYSDCTNATFLCPVFAVIPAGQRRNTHFPRFGLAISEATQAEWAACVADGGCEARPQPEVAELPEADRAKLPIVNVSWDDIQKYLQWLRKKTGEPYRLPSELEWEHASTVLPENLQEPGPDRRAWGENSSGRIAPVARRMRNAFRVHDMHGNVWEWTADCFADNRRLNQDYNPIELSNCDVRSIRGGGWASPPEEVGYHARRAEPRSRRSPDIGFRVAVTLDR